MMTLEQAGYAPMDCHTCGKPLLVWYEVQSYRGAHAYETPVIVAFTTCGEEHPPYLIEKPGLMKKGETMFTEKRQRFLFKAAKLMLDRDGRRSAELVLQIEPFTNTLVNRSRYDDLVLVIFNDGTSIQDGFREATWNPGLGVQGAKFRLDPDMDPELESVEVHVLRYRATRCEGKDDPDWVRFAITIDVPLAERKAREFVVNHFGHDVFVESWAVQPTLPAETR